MDNNGHRQDGNLEQRIYQVLALLERAGEQERMAAETLARASALEQRIDQGIQIASGAAAKRIAEEGRSALDGAIADSAESLRQAARGAVAAAENLRQPWWVHLVMIVMTGILSAAARLLGHPHRRYRRLSAGPAQPDADPRRPDARTRLA